MQYVKGVSPGAAVLKVAVIEPGYEHIVPVEVTILVVDPFVIEPKGPIYILPTSQFDFSLFRLIK
jgi:hypothetical protein